MKEKDSSSYVCLHAYLYLYSVVYLVSYLCLESRRIADRGA